MKEYVELMAEKCFNQCDDDNQNCNEIECRAIANLFKAFLMPMKESVKN